MNPTLTLDEQVCECLKSINIAYDYEICAIKNLFQTWKGKQCGSK